MYAIRRLHLLRSSNSMFGKTSSQIIHNLPTMIPIVFCNTRIIRQHHFILGECKSFHQSTATPPLIVTSCSTIKIDGFSLTMQFGQTAFFSEFLADAFFVLDAVLHVALLSLMCWLGAGVLVLLVTIHHAVTACYYYYQLLSCSSAFSALYWTSMHLTMIIIWYRFEVELLRLCR